MKSITKRRLASPALALLALVTFAGVASAAPAPHLSTFGDGEVTVVGSSASLVNDDGEYSGVYIKPRKLNKLMKAPGARRLANIHFSFKSHGNTGGGAPRFSIPLNTGTGETPYAFLDVNGCGTNVVSTDDDTCRVFINTGGEFDNWDALVAAHPTWRIRTKVAVPFIIADVPGTYILSNIDLT